MKRGVDEGVGGGGWMSACRGRNVTQHIDLSFVGRITVHDGEDTDGGVSRIGNGIQGGR